MTILVEYVSDGGVKLSCTDTYNHPRIFQTSSGGTELGTSSEKYYSLWPVIIEASGGIKTTGVATYLSIKQHVGVGGLKLAGVATTSWYRRFIFIPSGGIRYTSLNLFLKKKIPVPTGGVKVGGFAYKQKSVQHVTSGGIKSSGAVVVFLKKRYVPSGGLKASGGSVGSSSLSCIGSGGPKVSGTYDSVKKRSYNVSGGPRPQGNALFYINADQFIIDTVCTIGEYTIFWQHARELTANLSTEETIELRKLTINGRGMTPPPFSVTSFTTPIPIYFRKQGFEEISGTFYLNSVSINTEENEAWWEWSIEGVEVPPVTLTLNGVTLSWDQAREINVTFGIEDSDKRKVSVSGRGIVPPPFSVDSFADPVIITYSKDGNILTGTFDITSVSINGEGNDLWWSWSLEGGEVSDNPALRATFIIDGVTLTQTQAKELSASLSTDSTTEPRTISASGRGTDPPPFNVDSYTTPVSIVYSKEGTEFSGVFYITNISIEGEQEEDWWSWSVEGYEITPTTVSIGGITPTWDQARDLSASIEIDILGLKVVSISGRGILPFSVGPYSGPVTIIYDKDGSGFSGTFFVTGTSLEGEEDGAWWSWTVEASELTSATCSINGVTPTWDQARELTANYSTDEDAIKTISINGRGTIPFSPTLSTEPVYITYTKEGYGFSGYFTITSTSVDSNEDLWWEWSVEGKEKSDDAGNRAYITIDTLFTYDQAREITASIENLNAIYPVRTGNGSLVLRAAWTGKHKISVSGRGIVPPPILGNSLEAPVPVIYSKGGEGFAGTYFITDSSVEGEDDGKWWSWSVSGEEV